MVKALILGGTGFLGMALAKKMVAGNFNVKVFSPSASQKNSGIEGVAGFIHETDKLIPLLEWADLVFHFISTTTPKSSEADPINDINTNLLPFIHLLELLKKQPRKLIFCSTGGGVYGKSITSVINENHPRQPVTSYGLVKKTMEDYVLYYHQRYAIPFLILRPSNIYGSKVKSVGAQGIISTLISNNIKGEATHIWSDPDIKKDYLFIDDFAEAVILLLDQEGIFNIGSGIAYSVREIIRIVADTMGQAQKIYFDQKDYDDMPALLDISKVTGYTTWKPRTSLEQGVTKTIWVLKKMLQ